MCFGGGGDKKKELAQAQTNLANKQAASFDVQNAFMVQQQKFNDELQGLFKQQFAKQQGALDFLMAKMKPLIESPTGFMPGEEAAIRTSTTEAITREHQNAIQAAQARGAAFGARELPSGVQASIMGDVETARAAREGEAQRAITLEGSARKQQNFWSAAQMLGQGIAPQLAPSNLQLPSFTGAAVGAGGAATGAGSAAQGGYGSAYQATADAYRNNLGRILGGLAGGLSSTFLPSLGFGMGMSLFGKKKPTTPGTGSDPYGVQ